MGEFRIVAPGKCWTNLEWKCGTALRKTDRLLVERFQLKLSPRTLSCYDGLVKNAKVDQRVIVL